MFTAASRREIRAHTNPAPKQQPLAKLQAFQGPLACWSEMGQAPDHGSLPRGGVFCRSFWR